MANDRSKAADVHMKEADFGLKVADSGSKAAFVRPWKNRVNFQLPVTRPKFLKTIGNLKMNYSYRTSGFCLAKDQNQIFKSA